MISININRSMIVIRSGCWIILLLFMQMADSSAQQLRLTSNQVIAHRGAWKKNNLPQNSIASLRQAIMLGCAGSEFDVRMTADDSLIINHDSDFNGMQIEKSHYVDLIQHRLANGEKLPTLDEYLNEGLRSNDHTLMIIEIKPADQGKQRSLLVADKVYEMVVRKKMLDKVCFISFDYDVLLRLLKRNRHVNTQYLEGDRPPEQLRKNGINGADFHYSVYHDNPDWLSMSKKIGLRLNAWTVNDEAEMQWLLENSFDYITTNEPELLMSLLHQ